MAFLSNEILFVSYWHRKYDCGIGGRGSTYKLTVINYRICWLSLETTLNVTLLRSNKLIFIESVYL